MSVLLTEVTLLHWKIHRHSVERWHTRSSYGISSAFCHWQELYS